jgi:HEAT repeat protein
MIAQSPQLTAVLKTKRPGFRVTTIYAVLLVVSASSRAARAETPEQPARNILRAGVDEKNTGKRTQAVRALRLLPGNPEATEMARMALKDPKTDVRVAAANALGLMNSKAMRPITSCSQGSESLPRV